jgi:hypothetical protein
MSNEIFRKEALSQVAAPEQLNEYIKVSNPPMWAALAAVALLIVSGAYFAVTAEIPTVVSTYAVSDGSGGYVCLVSASGGVDLKPGMPASIDGTDAVVDSVRGTPLSRSEAGRSLPGGGEYAAWMMKAADWNVRAVLRVEAGGSGVDKTAPALGALVPVSITTAVTRPISFLFN